MNIKTCLMCLRLMSVIIYIFNIYERACADVEIESTDLLPVKREIWRCLLCFSLDCLLYATCLLRLFNLFLPEKCIDILMQWNFCLSI
jgi:hypothetical protein